MDPSSTTTATRCRAEGFTVLVAAMARIYRMVSIPPLVRRAAIDESRSWRWSEMFHPAIAAAVAHDRHTVMVKAADRQRSLRTISRTSKANGQRGR